jgi:hypothetical protein
MGLLLILVILKNVIVSSSVGPSRAYYIEDAESFVYRRDENGRKWKAISKGVPEPKRTRRQ